MFTPPPSPLPPPMQQVSSAGDDLGQVNRTPVSDTPSYPDAPWHPTKRKGARSLRWTIYLVPLVLILIAASTRFATHPAAFDSFSPSAAQFEWRTWTAQLANWTPHERHLDSLSLSTASLGPAVDRPAPLLSARGTPTTQGSTTVPVSPVIPTPFPQPFDTTLSTNFSSNSCYNFFVNMTQTDAFRSCRPFSLLLMHSQAFEEVR
ncbi:hypothetical protein BV22DRAFT_461158 [Leucogyrophana mollusca]|uniref:Uncharacterized protein n=1 Tax=Leucogyrophana mollusca TaxID=85980 RepID=A0ACB8BJT5_9AGAM|nr:hypothetical protein BV22DRAFT_461158 [Leucogyrophana mollusca]